MILFITEDFKLDLSHLNITFSEENTFFEKDLIKQFTFPFDIPKEKPFLPLYQFIGSHNSANKILIKGTLFYLDVFYDAELLVSSISNQTIKTVIYYDFITLDLLDKTLGDINFPEINTGEMFAFASATQQQNQINSSINFPIVYHSEAYPGSFSDNTLPLNSPTAETQINYDISNAVDYTVRGSILRPFAYLKYVIVTAFNLDNYEVSGDFINDEVIDKALLYHANEIYYTNKDFVKNDEDISLTFLAVGDTIFWDVYPNIYEIEIAIEERGFYKVEIDATYLYESNHYSNLEIGYKDNNGNFILYKRATGGNPINESFFKVDYPVEIKTNNSKIYVRLVCRQEVYDVAEINCKITGFEAPIYKEILSVSELIPEGLKVRDLLQNISESFNLNIKISTTNKTLVLDFYKSFLRENNGIDFTKYENENTVRKYNSNYGYALDYDEEKVYLNQTGEFQDSGIDFETITLPVLPLSFIERNIGNSNVEYNPIHGEGLRVLFYEANLYGLALYENLVFKADIKGFIKYFLLDWYYLLLNTETYESTLTTPLYEGVNIKASSKIFFYNNLFIIKNITKQRLGKLRLKLKITMLKIKYFD